MIEEHLAKAGIGIVWMDDSVLIVNKPSGVGSQAGRDGQPGVYELVRESVPYVALHHRLDQAASGLMILSLSREANAPLARAFREHTAERTYFAVLGGPIGDTIWDAPIDGKTARTDVELIGVGSGFSAVRLRLHTGRQHQIRMHAAMAGVAVLGDRRHGGELGNAWPRLALHAGRLRLQHPTTNIELDADAPIPDDMAMLWALAGG